MKKTNLILLVILLFLGGAAWWIFSRQSSNNLESGGDWEFAIQDTAKIYKVFMADREGRTITLTRQNAAQWTINGKHLVRQDAIKNVLVAFHNFQVAFRLPRQMVKTVVEDIATTGLKCEAYDKNGKLLKCFYMGGLSQEESATFAIQCDANEPYAINLKTGFIGAIRARFFMDSTDWRDRTIFLERLENIESASIEYPMQKDKSFKINVNGGNYQVEPFYSMQLKSPTPPNKGLVEAFLMGFSKQVAEGFENKNPQRDSITANIPFAIIAVKTKNGETKTVKLHPIVTVNRSGEQLKDGQAQIMVERYFANCSNGDFMMVQHQLFEKLLWAYQGFFQR